MKQKLLRPRIALLAAAMTLLVGSGVWIAAGGSDNHLPATRPMQLPKAEAAAPNSSSAADPQSNSLEGKPAPAISLDLVGGGKFSLDSYKNKDVVLLDFWATWCGPCRQAMPILVDVAKEYRDKGVLYFAVNLREDPAVVKQFLEKQHLKIQVPLDRNGKVADKYGVEGIPTMVVVDKTGTVRKVHVGYSENLKAEITKTLDQVLK